MSLNKKSVDDINVKGSVFDNIRKKWKLGKVAKMFGDIKLIAETMMYIKDFNLADITAAGAMANEIVLEACRLMVGPKKDRTSDFWMSLDAIYAVMEDAIENVSEVYRMIGNMNLMRKPH